MDQTSSWKAIDERFRLVQTQHFQIARNRILPQYQSCFAQVSYFCPRWPWNGIFFQDLLLPALPLLPLPAAQSQPPASLVAASTFSAALARCRVSASSTSAASALDCSSTPCASGAATLSVMRRAPAPGLQLQALRLHTLLLLLLQADQMPILLWLHAALIASGCDSLLGQAPAELLYLEASTGTQPAGLALPERK